MDFVKENGGFGHKMLKLFPCGATGGLGNTSYNSYLLNEYGTHILLDKRTILCHSTRVAIKINGKINEYAIIFEIALIYLRILMKIPNTMFGNFENTNEESR